MSKFRKPEDYELERISPSSIKKFQRCWRKWYFRHVLKISYPPSDAMKLGSKLHRDVEKYLKGEKDEIEEPENEELLFQGLIPHDLEYRGNSLDDEDSEVLVERYLYDAKATLEGVTLGGIVDLAFKRENTVLVVDWKYRSDIEDKGLESEVLEDCQPFIYSYCLDRLYKSDIDYFVICKVNILKASEGGPAIELAKAKVTRARVYEELRKLRNVVKSMKEIAQLPIEQVAGPEDDRVCFKYGKCQHWDPCDKAGYDPNATVEGADDWDMNALLPDRAG